MVSRHGCLPVVKRRMREQLELDASNPVQSLNDLMQVSIPHHDATIEQCIGLWKKALRNYDECPSRDKGQCKGLIELKRFARNSQPIVIYPGLLLSDSFNTEIFETTTKKALTGSA